MLDLYPSTLVSLVKCFYAFTLFGYNLNLVRDGGFDQFCPKNIWKVGVLVLFFLYYLICFMNVLPL